MLEPETSRDSEEEAPARSDWEESLSGEIEDLATTSSAFAEDWKRIFPPDAFENPLFIRAYAPLVRTHPVLRVFQAVLSRSIRSGADTPEAPQSSFDSRFEAGLRTASGKGPTPESPLPVGFFFYLDEAVSQARVQMAGGYLPDAEPITRILGFGRECLDHAALSAFRMDVFAQFPTGPLPHPGEPQKAGGLDPGPPEQLPPGEGAVREPAVPGTKTGPPALKLRPNELPVFPEGQALGPYTVKRLLGIGGFAQVYLVHHDGLAEDRAAKVFLRRQAPGPQGDMIRQAFYEEARTQVRLRHPNIVQVFDVFEHEGHLILIMEYVEGRSLRALIEEDITRVRRPEPLQILETALAVTGGLAHAHEANVIHRDLKPENILIPAGGVAKISDFGQARLLNSAGERRTERLGDLIGTAQYIAPEQVMEDVYDGRIDQYALGAVLYHLAYGAPPFESDQPLMVLEMHRSRTPVPLRDVLQDFPPSLEAIILKCLAKKPEERFASCRDLEAALLSCQAELERGGPQSQARSSRRKHGLLAVAALGLVCLAAVGVLFASGRFSSTPGAAAFPRSLGSLEAGLKTIPDAGPAATPAEKGPALPPSSPIGANPETPAPPLLLPPHKEASAAPPAPPAGLPSPGAARIPLRSYPVSAAEQAASDALVALFESERPALRALETARLREKLAALPDARTSEWTHAQRAAARELLDLSEALAQERWKALAASKTPLTLKLRSGETRVGVPVQTGPRTLTLRDESGTLVQVELKTLAPMEFLQGKTIPLAELAFGALSGDPADAARVLPQALELEAGSDKVFLLLPLLSRLAELDLKDAIQSLVASAEDPLGRGLRGEALAKALPSQAALKSSLKAVLAAEPAVLRLHPRASGSFTTLRHEEAALGYLLAHEYSRVLTQGAGTAAYRLAGTLLLADFKWNLEAGSQELIAGTGWLAHAWELRPDEASVKARTQFWDLLPSGGIVLRDPSGPRSLLMGRPHSRVAEGLELRFTLEALGAGGGGGEGAANAEARLLLRREGGKTSYLCISSNALFLRSFEGAVLASIALPAIASKANPRPPAPASAPSEAHVLTLIPGERSLHVLWDGVILTSFRKEDALLPSQPALSVVASRLEIHSLLVKKVPK